MYVRERDERRGQRSACTLHHGGGGERRPETSLAVVEVLTVWLLGIEAFRLALILLGCG